jgi:cytochrome P450
MFLTMAHPEVQEKLQEEIDAVVGRSRLPDLSDRQSLPYTNAVYKEVLRWHPIFPIGIPHRVMTEDEYKGMRIPSGSTVIPNVWFVTCSGFCSTLISYRIMTHDKTVYGSDADLFRPERFLEADLRDPGDIIFGFGRR